MIGKMENQKQVSNIQTRFPFLMGLIILMMSSCQKEVISTDNQDDQCKIGNLKITASKIVLLQGNENNVAFTLNWELIGGNPSSGKLYTLEAAINGTEFANRIELGSTSTAQFKISVKDLNNKVLNLINAGVEGLMAIRIKSEQLSGKNNVHYSEPIAISVIPCQFLRTYDENNQIRVPGNFQNWNLQLAPKIFSACQNGEYEGFINFSNPFSQFLMVKGSQWEANATYSYIGSNKFGFGGTVLSVFGGQGFYQLKANTNTNTWEYTKINSWGLFGSSVYDVKDGSKDKVMEYDVQSASWRITANLLAGDFRIRANGNDDISFGQGPNSKAGVPDYQGKDIHIAVSGKYAIVLKLDSPGNYYYGVQRIVE